MTNYELTKRIAALEAHCNECLRITKEGMRLNMPSPIREAIMALKPVGPRVEPATDKAGQKTPAEINPDIASQIVAMDGRLAEVMERIAALEAKTRPTPVALHAMAEAGVQQACEDLGVRKPIENRRDGPAPASGGDEAAVEWLRGLTMEEGDNRPYVLMSWKGDERRTAARAILAAIRSGAIPLPEDVPQISALRAELATAESARVKWREEAQLISADRDALAKRLAEAEEESKHLALHHEAAEKDKCHYRADRDRLAAQVEGLTRERERALQCHGDVPCGACITCLNGKLDRALADLAAERAAREKVEKLANRCRCIYCDADLSEADVEGNGAVIRAHIEVCPKHPLSAAQAKLAKAVGMLRVAREWGDYSGPHHYVDCHTETKNGSDCPVCKRRDEIDALLAEIGGGT